MLADQLPSGEVILGGECYGDLSPPSVKRWTQSLWVRARLCISSRERCGVEF